MSDKPATIDATFRNGSMTAIGIIIGFSLSFLRSWGANPVPWQWVDVFAVVPLLAGLTLQVWAFAQLLKPESMLIGKYTSAKNQFLAGMVLVLAGVAIALLLDILQQSAPDMLR